jgi:hypothetical protein
VTPDEGRQLLKTRALQGSQPQGVTITLPEAASAPDSTGKPGKGHPRPTGYCKRCGKTWTSRLLAHCSASCRSFSGPTGFDRHRVDFTCRDPATLTKPDGSQLFVVEDGVWRYPGHKPEGLPYAES